MIFLRSVPCEKHGLTKRSYPIENLISLGHARCLEWHLIASSLLYIFWQNIEHPNIQARFYQEHTLKVIQTRQSDDFLMAWRHIYEKFWCL